VFSLWIAGENPEFVPINKDANDRVMHFLKFRKANSFSGESFDSRTKRQMFAFY
jgi:hypothetical protein